MTAILLAIPAARGGLVTKSVRQMPARLTSPLSTPTYARQFPVIDKVSIGKMSNESYEL